MTTPRHRPRSRGWHSREISFFDKVAKGVPSHPWFGVSDPQLNPEDVLIVNLTDADTWDDDACRLDGADHPGVITKRSCVAYSLAKVTSVKMLEMAIASGLIIEKPPLPQAAFDKILEGFLFGDVKAVHQKLLRSQGLIP